ncbi:fungalysin/thermolysin propeptide [Nocardia tenerifensis]|uniref:Fungalysin/thermolysin propeptide n=1 Tax=Nocardia tenerifensis TaxID=228006 RepID=A0A318K115_9NOCA|nr:hypothetical protein [Nocardia tenerifensis]PXX61036.1 fungalysin/thermolysin propeptide [Nocardia tenerifensis]
MPSTDYPTTSVPTTTTTAPTTKPGIFDLPAIPKNVFTDPDGIFVQVILEHPLPIPPGTPTDAPAIAQARAQGLQQVLGAESVGNLVVDTVSPTGDGGATVRQRQEIDSVPVFGAEVAQSLAADGSLVSAGGALAQQARGKYPTGTTTTPTGTTLPNGTTLPTGTTLPNGTTLPTGTTPPTAVTPRAAVTPPAAVTATAVRALAAETRQSRDKFSASAPVAMWYDPKLAAKKSAKSVAVPAYKVTVEGVGAQGGPPSRWVVFVDATDVGKVLDSWSTTGHPECADRTPSKCRR